MIDGAALTRWLQRHPRRALAAATLLVALPLLVALVALRSQRWFPVLDLAMTELRVRDVGGGHTPLIGLPGRIGAYPNQGSHPGPMSFYLLAPVYRLLGSSPWALEAATVAIHVAAIATALWIGQRRASWRGVLGVAALLLLVIRGYGQLLLTQPWNPYLPLLAWIVVLLAVWSVLCGDTLMLVPLVVAATLCAQTHVPYLVPCAALTIGAIGISVWRRRGVGGEAAVALGLGVVVWLPPLIDQLTNDPGNVRKLLDHFGDPPEAVLGLGEGVRLALRHLDVWAGFAGTSGGELAGSGGFVSPAVAWRGAIMLSVWAFAAVVAWRRGPSALRTLHLVIASGLVLGLVSMTRIFGLAWYYLTLWAWGITSLALGAVAWTALSSARRHWGQAARRLLPAVASALAVLALVSSTISFAGAEVPEERLSVAVAALAGPTYDAVVAGTGPASGDDAPYQVRWSDAADIGSPGFGLFDELERRGLDVSADEYFHVPVTDHRVAPRADDVVQIHVATGGFVERWRQVPGAVEVATYEPRTNAEQHRYADVRSQLVARLRVEGLGEVAEVVDTNLFGASLDPRLSADDHADLTELLDLGQQMAVFLAPGLADAVS